MSKKRNRRKGLAVAPRSKRTGPADLCRTVTDWYLLFVMGLFPLIIGMGEYGYSNIVNVKAWTWLAVTGLWALCLAGGTVRARIKKQPLGVSFGWTQWTAVAFLAAAVLSALLSDHVRDCLFRMDPSNTNSVLFMASYTAAFIGLSCYGRLARRHMLALGISASLAGLLCVIQLAGYNPLTMYPEGMTYYNKHREYAGAFLGTMGNIDHLAAFLCFAIPTLVVYALRSAVRRDRLLLLPALLSLYVLYTIDVDAGKVGMAGCLVLAPPVVIRSQKGAKYACAVSAAAVLLGLAAVYFWPGQSGFIHEASQILHGHVEPSYGHDRIGIWQLAWTYVREHPIIGNGPGSGAWLLQSIREVNEEMNRVTVTYNVHNTYLGYLMEGGLLSLGCYLAILGGAAWGWVRRCANDGLAALGAGVACYLVQDFFSLNLVVAAPFLWVGLGLLAGTDARKVVTDGTHHKV